MAAERGAAAVRALPAPGGEVSYDRVPPHNLDAELSVIGSMLLSRDAIAEVSELVGPEEFYRGAYRTMFEGIRSLYDRGEPVDAITLADELQHSGSLEDIGGVGGIADVVARVPTAANALYYARIVAAQSLRRRLIDCGTQITRLGYTDTEEVGESVDQAERLVYRMSQQGRVSEFVAIKSLLNAGFARIETLHESNQAVTGLATGFTDLDELTAGLQPSNLIILAARPSMGKSTMVTNIATHVAVELRKSVVLFSLEMSSMELIQRILAAEARVDSDRLRTGRLVDADWPKLSQAMGRLAETQLHIDDTPGINLLEIRSKARRLKQRHGLDLIIVDYLQLMQSHRRVENRVQEVSELSRGLKILSKELDIPVIALSQLSRRPEERHDRRPQLSDLRESGCLTGETEVVLSTGETAPLASLCGRRAEVATLDGWRMGAAVSTKIWRTGTRPVFRMRLASGREIRATGSHRFRTLVDWRPLEQLALGDRIAVPRRYATATAAPSAEHWDEDRLVLLAHLVGDGCYASRQPLHYTSASPLNIEAVEGAALRAFGVVGRRVRQENWEHLYLSSGGNRWRPNPIRVWLRQLGIDGQRSEEKRLPADVLGLHEAQVSVLLRHLWATDGCVWVRKPGAKGPVGGVYYATSSPQLARQVQHLLTRLGILARIQTVPQGAYSPAFHVLVTGRDDQLRFVERVGGYGDRAQRIDALRRELERLVSNTNADTIPVEVWKLVRERMVALGISQRKMTRLRGTAYGGYSHFRFAPSRAQLESYAAALDSRELKELAAADVYWDRVVEIEPDGVQDVYDMTVSGAHNFVAGGIVVHNSIEQDADVVCFIYRDEVYDQESAAKGEAELIVAKHRNGPLATVRLAFLGSTSRFASLRRGGTAGAPPGASPGLPPDRPW